MKEITTTQFLLNSLLDDELYITDKNQCFMILCTKYT